MFDNLKTAIIYAGICKEYNSPEEVISALKVIREVVDTIIENEEELIVKRVEREIDMYKKPDQYMRLSLS